MTDAEPVPWTWPPVMAATKILRKIPGTRALFPKRFAIEVKVAVHA